MKSENTFFLFTKLALMDMHIAYSVQCMLTIFTINNCLIRNVYNDSHRSY